MFLIYFESLQFSYSVGLIFLLTKFPSEKGQGYRGVSKEGNVLCLWPWVCHATSLSLRGFQMLRVYEQVN